MKIRPYSAVLTVILMVLILGSIAQATDTNDDSSATLEGVVVDAQKKADRAGDAWDQAKEQVTTKMSSADKSTWNDAEDELNGLVVDAREKKIEVVVQQDQLAKAKLVYQKEPSPEHKNKVDERSEDYQTAVEISTQAQRKMQRQKEVVEKIESKVMPGTAQELIRQTRQNLMESRTDLALAKERLKLARADEDKDSGHVHISFGIFSSGPVRDHGDENR